MREGLNLKGLECFKAIVETGSATGAAEKLGLSQPRISSLLTSLEKRVGLKLFDRKRGRLNPTHAANMLFPEVEQMLANISRISSAAKNLQSAGAGTINIGSPPNKVISAKLLEKLLSAHHHANPVLWEGSSQAVLKWLRNGKVDCGIIEMPLDPQGLHCTPLFSSTTACLMNPDHKLAQNSVISVADLHREPLVLMKKFGHMRRDFDELYAQSKSSMKVQVEVNACESAFEMVSSGLGIGIVSRSVASILCAHSQLVLIPLKPDLTHSVCFVTNAETPESRMVSALRNCCLDFFAPFQEESRATDAQEV